MQRRIAEPAADREAFEPLEARRVGRVREAWPRVFDGGRTVSRTSADRAAAAAGKRVLLVEDEVGVSDVIVLALRRAGLHVSACRDIRQARVALEWGPFDAAVVDVALPDGNGLDLVADISAGLPVIVISGEYVTAADRVLGLDEGADDYLVKPFSAQELVARVKAVLRRGDRAAHGNEHLRYGGLEVNLATREVRIEDRLAHFTRKEFDLLAALAARPGRTCSYGELVRWVWAEEPGRVSPRNVTEHVRRVRAKLGDSAHRPRWIVTLPGVGYRFDGDRVSSDG
jgi:DNA-binding response OmpR family regulator